VVVNRAFRFRKKYSDSIPIQHITAVYVEAYRLLSFTMLSWVTFTTSQRRRLWRQL